jgi:hypothetical protein
MDDGDSNHLKERSLFVRTACCILWFIPFFFLTNIMVEIVVAGVAGFKAGSFQEGKAIGQSAVNDFFQENYLFIFAFQLMAYWGLCLLSWVPGVGKYKKTKRHEN